MLGKRTILRYGLVKAMKRLNLGGGLLRVLAALGLWWCACGGDHDRPPPSTTSTAPVTSTAPPEPTPEDYITLERAGECGLDRNRRDDKSGLCLELYFELQENASRGWRDFLVLAEICPWSLAPNPGAIFPVTVDAIENAAAFGAELDRDGWGFMERLGEVNRRCDEQPRFCGRTNVQKERFSNDEGTGYRDKLREHLAWAERLRLNIEGQPGFGTKYDSIAGWCQNQ